MSHTPHAPGQLYELREWLLDRIDGSEETRGDDGLISDFIRQIDALPSSEMGTIPDAERKKVMDAQLAATVEPKGCPTPGSCSAVEELADLKQRLLPQYLGRAERAEKARQMAVVERDALLEKLIVHQTTVANLHDVIDGMREKFNAAERDKSHDTLSRSAPSATAAPPVEAGEPDRPDWARQLPGAEIFDRAARVNHGYDRTASLNSGRYVCLCGGACSHYDAQQPSHTTGEKP